MIRHSILKMFLVSFFLQSQALAAQNLSWSDCVIQASQNNPELLAAQSTFSSAQAIVSGAYSGFFPQVTGTLGYSYGNSVARPDDTNLSYSATISASQNLFSGFYDTAKVDQAKAAQTVAMNELIATKSSVSYDLKSAFVNLVYAQNLVQLTDDIIKRREYNLRLVQLRFENGGENKGSVLLSKAYLEQAKLDSLQAKNVVGLAQIQLKKVLGFEPSDLSIQVTGEVPVAEVSALPDLKSIALLGPDYLKSVAQVDSARAGLTLARSEFFPSLNLTGSTGRTGADWFPENNRWSVGLSLSFPLFNGGRDYNAYKSASENYRASEFKRQSISNESLEKVKLAYSTYEESVQKLNVDRAFSEAAIVRQKIAREKYNNGLLSFDNWDIIETDLINRQKSFLQSQRERIIDEAAWEQAQGKGVIP